MPRSRRIPLRLAMGSMLAMTIATSALAQVVVNPAPIVPAPIAIRPVPVPPDLVITGFTFANCTPVTTTPCFPGQVACDLGACGNPQFLVTVTNNGPGIANGNTGVQVSINGSFATGAPLTLNNLAPGASVTVTVGSYLGPCDTLCNGWQVPYTFGARVDATNTIPEANEGNNVWTGAPLRACRHCP